MRHSVLIVALIAGCPARPSVPGADSAPAPTTSPCQPTTPPVASAAASDDWIRERFMPMTPCTAPKDCTFARSL